MSDEEIIALYFARDQEALAQTDKKYGAYCYTLANRILSSPPDAEETVSDTYFKAWQAIPPTKPKVLRLFLAKITRSLAFTRWRRDTAQKRGGGEMPLVLDELGECIGTGDDLEAGLNLRELTRTIAAFLDTQPQREQNIFLRRYFFLEDSREIGSRYQMKPEAVLQSLSRTRKKLKNYLIQEGYTV